MRLIVCGSRNFHDYEFVKTHLYYFCRENDVTEIVSGGCDGVDKLGEIWATEHDTPIKVFPANWSKYGKSAGPIRNEEMAKYADACLAFWDGNSRGTKNMISLAERYKLKGTVVNIKS